MKLPRDISGEDLAKLLRIHEFQITRQKGSHLRLTTFVHGEYHITIPDHKPIKIGTLNKILTDISHYLNIDKEIFIQELFGGS